MSYTNEGRGILPVIQSIASKRETGELEIRSARHHGVLRFSKGKLVDATFGTLSGFQAINAAVALSDLQVTFKPLSSTLRPGSIAANERRVLKSFFGIEAADASDDVVEPPTEWNTTPHQVVPLVETDLLDTPTVEVRRIAADDVAESAGFVSNETPAETPFVADRLIVEPLSARADVKPAVLGEGLFQSRRERRGAEFWRRVPVAAVVMLLVALAAAAAITLIPKLKSHHDMASVPSTPAEQAAASAPSPTSDTPPDTHVAAGKPDTVAPQSTAPTSRAETPSPTVAVREREQSTQSDVQDLTGEWRIINTVDKTAYQTFQNMQIGFRLKIHQKGNDFTATGEKVSENGRALPTRSRTPIHVTGSINGDNVVATFVEQGSMRKTSGRFSWRLQNENASLTGTFVTAAANSSGKSEATREQ
jgi:hypothetical protein